MLLFLLNSGLLLSNCGITFKTGEELNSFKTKYFEVSKKRNWTTFSAHYGATEFTKSDLSTSLSSSSSSITEANFRSNHCRPQFSSKEEEKCVKALLACNMAKEFYGFLTNIIYFFTVTLMPYEAIWSAFICFTMTARAYLLWRVQAAVSPMTRRSDNSDEKWSIQNAAQHITAANTYNQIYWK